MAGKKQKKSNYESDGSSSSHSEDVAPFEHARPDDYDGESVANGGGGETEDGGDDFIVEDGDNTIELPGQFSRNRHRDFSENFKILCQLFVHAALQKPADRELYMTKRLEGQWCTTFSPRYTINGVLDEYFSLARDDLRKKISGILTQSITSQIWKKDFMDSLRKYPDLSRQSLEEVVYFCHACNSTRPATVYATVHGDPYKEMGFEPQSDESDDEDAPDLKECTLGRFCAYRGRLFHTFIHWEVRFNRVINTAKLNMTV